jgi:hypothetical protein
MSSDCIQVGEFDNYISPKITIGGLSVGADVGEHEFHTTFNAPISAYTGNISTIKLSYNDKLPNKTKAISKTHSVWDFGDGTQEFGNDATHTFTEPGLYKISLTVIDVCGEPYKLPDPYVCKIYIYDYFPTGVVWATQGSLSALIGHIAAFVTEETSAYIMSQNTNNIFVRETEDITSTSNIIGNALDALNTIPMIESHKSIPLTLHMYKSWQNISGPSTATLYVSGSNSPPLTEVKYDNDKYAHFVPTHRVIPHSGTEASRPLTQVTVPQTDIYLNQTGDVVDSDTPGSIFIGTSGQLDLRYVDDSQQCISTIFASQILSEDSLNNMSSAIMMSVTPYTGDLKLSITSNGLESFPLSGTSGVRFADTSIPFVVGVTSGLSVSLPNVLSDLDIGVSDISLTVDESATTQYTILSSDIASTYEYIPNKNIFFTLSASSNIESGTSKLSAVTTIDSTSVSGESVPFELITEVPKISKIGEDNNLFKIIKSFILQETINTKESFVNSFLRSAIGDDTAPPSYFGTRVYEKITNFTKNINDIDTCNISALYSLAKSVGYNNISTDTESWPGEFKRILDLLSITKNKLFGYRRPTLENFDKKGFTDNPKYGPNLGDLIGTKVDGKYDCSNYTVSAGSQIVAKQIYDSKFILIRPMYLDENHTLTYSLSDYSANWGWGLYSEVADTGVFDLYKYYEFYNYDAFNENATITEYEASVKNKTYTKAISGFGPVNNLINWETSDTTVSYLATKDQWVDTVTKIIERELRYKLNLLAYE